MGDYGDIDEYVLNKKLGAERKMQCENCDEFYDPKLGQGVDLPSQLYVDECSNFCDASCVAAYALMMLMQDFEPWYHALCDYLKQEIYVPPIQLALKKFGGDMSIEEYKPNTVKYDGIFVPRKKSHWDAEQMEEDGSFAQPVQQSQDYETKIMQEWRNIQSD